MRYLTLAAATIAAAGAVHAAPQVAPPPPRADSAPPPAPPSGKMRRMMRADGNGDGIITRDEAIALATRQFDRVDANRDGRLDQAELAAGPRGRRGGPRAAGRDMPPPPPADDDRE